MKASAMTRAKIGLAFLLTILIVAVTVLLIAHPVTNAQQAQQNGELHDLLGVLIAVYSFVIHSIFATPHEAGSVSNPTQPANPALPTGAKP